MNLDFGQAFEMYLDAWRDYATKDVESLITRNLSSWELEYWNAFYISLEIVDDADEEYWINVTSNSGETYMFMLYGDVPEKDIPDVIMELYDEEYDNRFGNISKYRLSPNKCSWIRKGE